MADIGGISVPLSKVMSSVTVKVTVTGVRVFKLRLWTGALLIKLAAIVIGCSSVVLVDSGKESGE